MCGIWLYSKAYHKPIASALNRNHLAPGQTPVEGKRRGEKEKENLKRKRGRGIKMATERDESTDGGRRVEGDDCVEMKDEVIVVNMVMGGCAVWKAVP